MPRETWLRDVMRCSFDRVRDLGWNVEGRGRIWSALLDGSSGSKFCLFEAKGTSSQLSDATRMH